MPTSYSESDMSLPIKDYFVGLGYKVHSEVKGVDITAVKDLPLEPCFTTSPKTPPPHPNNNLKKPTSSQELIIIEIKKTFSLKLIYQALERLKITNSVYVAIPRPKKNTRKDIKGMVNLAKKLEIGLIFVNMSNTRPSKSTKIPLIDIIVLPPIKKQKNTIQTRNILKEINERSIDINKGGSRGVKIMTAYKEKSICLALILQKNGPMKPLNMKKRYPFIPENSRILMYNNFMGWFTRMEKGLYYVTDKAFEEISQKNYKPIVKHYEKLINEQEVLNQKEWIYEIFPNLLRYIYYRPV